MQKDHQAFGLGATELTEDRSATLQQSNIFPVSLISLFTPFVFIDLILQLFTYSIFGIGKVHYI
jgi:hypothetical protein